MPSWSAMGEKNRVHLYKSQKKTAKLPECFCQNHENDCPCCVDKCCPKNQETAGLSVSNGQPRFFLAAEGLAGEKNAKKFLWIIHLAKLEKRQ